MKKNQVVFFRTCGFDTSFIEEEIQRQADEHLSAWANGEGDNADHRLTLERGKITFELQFSDDSYVYFDVKKLLLREFDFSNGYDDRIEYLTDLKNELDCLVRLVEKELKRKT
jgi:hypothetical protein